MPTYDYRCNACGHEFEQFQSITAPVMRKCPSCSRLKLERLIGTGAGVIFKGGGFYETDYRSESYRKAAEAEKSAAQGGGDVKKSDAPAKSDTTDGGTAASKKSTEQKAESSAPAASAKTTSTPSPAVGRGAKPADSGATKKTRRRS